MNITSFLLLASAFVLAFGGGVIFGGLGRLQILEPDDEVTPFWMGVVGTFLFVVSVILGCLAGQYWT